jgi:hypothetical protein
MNVSVNGRNCVGVDKKMLRDTLVANNGLHLVTSLRGESKVTKKLDKAICLRRTRAVLPSSSRDMILLEPRWPFVTRIVAGVE